MTLGYFFDPYPPLLLPASNTIALTVIGAGAAMSMAFIIIARMFKREPPRRRFFMRVMRWCVATTALCLLFYFFRQQRVYFLSAPILAATAFLGMLGWLWRLVTMNVRRIHEEEKIRQAKEMRKKYFS